MKVQILIVFALICGSLVQSRGLTYYLVRRLNNDGDISQQSEPRIQFQQNFIPKYELLDEQQFQSVAIPKAAPPSNIKFSKIETSNLQSDVINSCSSNPCINEGKCVEVGTSYECKCPWGWTGQNCEICLTDCSSNPCPSEKRCKAIYGGGFECVCPADRVGPNCEILNDLCASNPCLNGGQCKPAEDGQFTCVCTKPWSGDKCDQIWDNPCTAEVVGSTQLVQFKDPWNRNGYIVCLDIGIHQFMSCPVGTFYNERYQKCVPEGYYQPICPDDYCQNSGECVMMSRSNQMYQDFKCLCKKGFTGPKCEVNIDECASKGNESCAGGICVDQVNGFYCECPTGIGLNCQDTIPNPCTLENISKQMQFFELPSPNKNVFLQCVSENVFVLHRCENNLYWNDYEKSCSIELPLVITGVCSSMPCKNGGECKDLGSNNFECECKNGYTGDFCDKIIDYCASNPCQNSGKCESFVGGYNCLCPDQIIDECCCNGIINPCPTKPNVLPGANSYFPHLFPNRYLQCDSEGRAFARTCAPGTKWNQEILTCLPGDYKFEPESEEKPLVVPKLAPQDQVIAKWSIYV